MAYFFINIGVAVDIIGIFLIQAQYLCKRSHIYNRVVFLLFLGSKFIVALGIAGEYGLYYKVGYLQGVQYLFIVSSAIRLLLIVRSTHIINFNTSHRFQKSYLLMSIIISFWNHSFVSAFYVALALFQLLQKQTRYGK